MKFVSEALCSRAKYMAITSLVRRLLPSGSKGHHFRSIAQIPLLTSHAIVLTIATSLFPLSEPRMAIICSHFDAWAISLKGTSRFASSYGYIVSKLLFGNLPARIWILYSGISGFNIMLQTCFVYTLICTYTVARLTGRMSL